MSSNDEDPAESERYFDQSDSDVEIIDIDDENTGNLPRKGSASS